MDILDIDIETYSTVELKKANVYRYVEDPAFEVMMAGWSLNESPIEVWEGEPDIDRIPGLWDPEVKKVAHNAGFERVCLSRMRGMPVGEYLPPEDWFDTLAIAAEYGLPRSLDALAKALGVTPKDTAGTRLINLFCKPYRGKRVMAHQKPIQWKEFGAYCRQDVSTLQEVRQKLPGWPSEFERELWYVDQRINDRGIRVDLAMARMAHEAAEANTVEAEREVIRISGVENPGSTKQLGIWTASRDAPMQNWQALTVSNMLMRSDLSEDVRNVLELRQELALVTSNKYIAALRSVSCDGRLRGQFVFHAAHTGRWSSRGVQLHNLAKKSFVREDEDGEEITDWGTINAKILDLLLGLGAAPEELKKLVRPMFLVDGTISDLSAIEARILAWLSGEQWVLDAFLTGRDLYVETAERMGGGMGRPEGKIAVLAAGYQGSVGSFRNMGYGGRQCPFDGIKQIKVKDPRTGREYEKVFEDVVEHGRAFLENTDVGYASSEAIEDFLTKARKKRMPIEDIESAIRGHLAEVARDPEHKCDVGIKKIVNAWREANDHIRQFWYELERKFLDGGVVGTGKITVEVWNGMRNGRRFSHRRVHLPSGRVLTYRDVRKSTRVDPETGEDEVDDYGRKRLHLSYRHVQGYRDYTYGGRLTENVTQAVARDILADAMIRLDQAGYPMVAHIHDEVVVESQDKGGIREVMRTGPAWAEGLPLDASADITARYTK